MQLTGRVEKSWGAERIWITNERYTSKFMDFKKDSKFSMHFHVQKDEAWYVLSGKFNLKVINTDNSEVIERELNVGDVWRNIPLLPHQLTCLEEGTILEVSTPDSVEDNFRIGPGDSQLNPLVMVQSTIPENKEDYERL
jgi:mannose-6-phosphate isomerase-like protein (cupin superfamily)